MNHRILTAALIALPIAALSACGSSTQSGELDSEMGEGSVVGTEAIKPSDFLKCWIDADTRTSDSFFKAHTIRCAAQRNADYPLQPSTYAVEYETPSNRGAGAVFEGGEATIGRIRNEDFPVKLYVKLLFPNSSETGSTFGLKQIVKISSLTETSAERPKTLASPFSLWPVEIVGASGERLVLSAGYEVKTAAYAVGYNFTIPDTDPSVLRLQTFAEAAEGVVTLAMIAPEAGPIRVTVNGVVAFIDGPGNYEFDGESLRKRASTEPPAPAPVGETAPPPPSCGTADTQPCEGNTCAPKHQLKGGSCQACGTHGLPACVSAQGNSVCEPGHRLQNDKCTSCGEDGQVACQDAHYNNVCNEGHRVQNGSCKVCGGDGQIACTSSSGSYVCNEGHRVLNGSCKVCGGDGQIACTSSSGSYVCNDGYRVQNGNCTKA